MSIERKSWRDYLNCLHGRQTAFIKQIGRLNALPYGYIIVEGNLSMSAPGGWAESLYNWDTVRSKSADLIVQCKPRLIFSGGRRDATDIALMILKAVHNEHQ